MRGSEAARALLPAGPDGKDGTRSALEDALREQRRVLATLIGNIDGMVYRCRHDPDWTMESVSEGCLALTGWRADELLAGEAITYERVIHPDDRQHVRTEVANGVQENRRFRIEYRINCRDGTLKWVLERGAAVRDDAGDVIALEGVIEDITERRIADEALRDAERRYRSIFENATEGIYQSTAEGRYLSVNPALARIFGYVSPEELLSITGDVQHRVYVDSRRRREFLRLMREDGRVVNFVSQAYRKDGELIWISENAHPVTDESGCVTYFEGTVVDVTETRRYEQELVRLASHDPLTDLPNRHVLNDRLRQMLLHAQRHNSVVAVAFVDLDNFKIVNDSLGHNIGDRLLMTMAKRMKSCLRESDTVARMGGDEFVLLLSGESRGEAMGSAVRRVLHAIAAPCQIEGHELTVSCSIGISMFPRDGRDVGTLLKAADTAMYRAKEAGRNNFQFYTADMNSAVTARLETEAELRRALERGEFLLHYQPKFDLPSGRIVGAEALVRWQHPRYGLVSPQHFITIAEETGLIVPIGEWVLRSACRFNQSLVAAGLGALRMAVNLSARQFHHEGLAVLVREVLDDTGLKPELLELELTESLVMHEAEHVTATLAALEALGIHLSIDDFGTGYSSLSYLKRFPVSNLKIDKSFVHDIARDPDDAAIVNAIVLLGHGLGLTVTAEGVENRAQLEFLAAHACDEVQGDFCGAPMTEEALRQVLATRPQQDLFSLPELPENRQPAAGDVEFRVV
jgi:diguanylate cyclase (GGDEF)-like protein/PAS domain S-box-containing protein